MHLRSLPAWRTDPRREGLSEQEAIEQCLNKKYICFKKELPILGKVALFLNVDTQKGNDVVLFMRCPRMVVGAQRNNSSRGYSAVFLCYDNRAGKGNDLLRNMEDAAHRTWSKRQLKLDKRPQEMVEQAGEIENEMIAFINWCIDVVFPASQADSVDVELDDFTVPMLSDNDTSNPLIGSLINKKGDNDKTLGAPVDIHAGSNISKNKSGFIGKAQVVENKRVKKTEEDTDFSGGRKRNHPVNPGPTPKPNGDNHYKEDDEGEERLVRVKFPVKYRIFSEETSDGRTLYTLIIHSPQEEEKAYITLTPVGETEDKSCNVNIQTSSVGRVRENEILDVPLKEGKNVISFSVDNSGEYAFSLLAEHDM